MQVSNPNDIRIYNLSAGKSLPEWLSDRKKRSLQKQDVDIRRRIELIQDFEMPTVSHRVAVSPDGQYVCAVGTYKPRIRCYDVNQLSLKFERGLDSDVVKFLFLSEDYSKLVFLQCDRYLEFHSQFGRYYRTRIPKFGRDLAYNSSSCDLYIAGITADIYRLNVEQGRYLSPLKSSASEVNCCELNPSHGLLACGTSSGKVECFDPRVRNQVGELDTALASHIEDLELSGIPSVTALKFSDSLNIGVGTNTGHVLLYDLRSHKPLLIKDHQYDLPIKSIEFHNSMDLVLSMDTKILKLWNKSSGKAFTAIEPGSNLNDLCVLSESGLLFMANEAPKILTYYLPALGTAPKWCSFLDNLTEELEESNSAIVYDDYKFVTRKELEDLSLSHLIGSNLLRAYMHGFFMDNRLYHKARSVADPFAFDDYRKRKIREKIDQERVNRVKLRKLPKVNRDLAEKLMDMKEMADSGSLKKSKNAVNLLEDDRFSSMFTNPEFQIDINSEEYRLMNPVVSKLDKIRRKKQIAVEKFEEVEGTDGENNGNSESDDSSSDDEHVWTDKLKEEHRKLKKKRHGEEQDMSKESTSKLKFYELKEGQDVNRNVDKAKKKEMKKPLSERLEDIDNKSDIKLSGRFGNKEMIFRFKRSEKETIRQLESKQHIEERKKLRRSAGEITKGFKQKPKYWMGKKV